MSRQRKYDLIIFDWDGTLADSTGRIVDSMHIAGAACELPKLSDDQVRNIIGLGLPEAIRMLWPDINETQMPTLHAAYAQHFVHDSLVPMGFFDGAETMLDQLVVSRKLAVATGKSRKGLDRILDDLQAQRWFAATRCADETLSKPNPLMLQQLLDELGVSVESAIMIGDTSYDLDMAAAIGMDRIGMTHGAHHQDVLLACQPLALCHTINELHHWIENNG
ncbi:MAG: HAD-IA family hydrolase [Oleibacter sp.]|nr:HAD-IA family hydrolase [Thalassolituus sp.]